jgi:hypothetical protein
VQRRLDPPGAEETLFVQPWDMLGDEPAIFPGLKRSGDSAEKCRDPIKASVQQLRTAPPSERGRPQGGLAGSSEPATTAEAGHFRWSTVTSHYAPLIGGPIINPVVDWAAIARVHVKAVVRGNEDAMHGSARAGQ